MDKAVHEAAAAATLSPRQASQHLKLRKPSTLLDDCITRTLLAATKKRGVSPKASSVAAFNAMLTDRASPSEKRTIQTVDPGLEEM